PHHTTISQPLTAPERHPTTCLHPRPSRRSHTIRLAFTSRVTSGPYDLFASCCEHGAFLGHVPTLRSCWFYGPFMISLGYVCNLFSCVGHLKICSFLLRGSRDWSDGH